MPRGGRQQRGWGSHMLNGVPFELRWKPRQLPDLPESPPPVRPQLLASWSGCDYDFGLEHRVLYPPEAAAAKEQDAVKKQQQQQTNDAKVAPVSKAEKSSQVNSTKSTGNEDLQPTKRNGYLPQPPSVSQSSISTFNMSKDPLKPQPVIAAAAVSASTDKASFSINSLKDFDRIDDPFDEAELRTIDDMAELKNALSGFAARGCAVDVSDDSSSGGGQSNRSPVPSVHEITFPKLSLGPDSPTTSESPPVTSTTAAALPQPPPPLYQAAAMAVSTAPVSMPPPPPPQPLPPSSVVSTAPVSIPHQFHLSSSQPRAPWSSSMNFGGQIAAATADSFRSASHPDLASAATAGPPPVQQQQQQQPAQQTKTSNAKTATYSKPSGPDPYPDLGVLERFKVDSLCAMGFPRDRAARAVARLGMADDELVAYLCRIDRIVEACEVSPPDAENSIRLLGSEAKAIRYLHLRAEMLEFGFSQDDIAAAALASNLDRDRTVALLLKQNGLSLN
ncbi:hypothetical protein BOX15_Mlig022294g1 [Macrostomum lignano]|uniref:Uncharacterized protein n=2 Tax=Macrostomum lignano TaxID=282301 RepID=A0A267FM69_9PLAT|nr:hypothetical protein BOX15_Mlig022294g1 [Macrostomum lignano]